MRYSYKTRPPLRLRRAVIVDGRSYRWGAVTLSDSYRLYVEADGGRQRLRVENIPLLPQDWRGRDADADIGDQVADVIRAALGRGWLPESGQEDDFVL